MMMGPKKTLADVMEVAYAAKAHTTTGIVFVERACDMPENEPAKGYWYDIQVTGAERKHDFLYDDLAALIDTLYELDVPVDMLAWEVTAQHVDFGTCTCRACKQYCLEHHVIPRGTRLPLAWCYRVRFLYESLCWWMWVHFLLLRDRFEQAMDEGSAFAATQQEVSDEEGARDERADV